MRLKPDEKFMTGLSTAAYEYDMEVKFVDELEDGFIKVTFHKKREPDLTMSVEFRIADQEFKGRLMLEVKRNQSGHEPTFFVSPIPYVLFGAMYCQF